MKTPTFQRIWQFWSPKEWPHCPPGWWKLQQDVCWSRQNPREDTLNRDFQWWTCCSVLSSHWLQDSGHFVESFTQRVVQSLAASEFLSPNWQRFESRSHGVLVQGFWSKRVADTEEDKDTGSDPGVFLELTLQDLRQWNRMVFARIWYYICDKMWRNVMKFEMMWCHVMAREVIWYDFRSVRVRVKLANYSTMRGTWWLVFCHNFGFARVFTMTRDTVAVNAIKS